MYPANSSRINCASALTKSYRASSNELVTELVNFSVTIKPQLVEQFDLFHLANNEPDKFENCIQSRPNGKQRHV